MGAFIYMMRVWWGRVSYCNGVCGERWEVQDISLKADFVQGREIRVCDYVCGGMRGRHDLSLYLN